MREGERVRGERGERGKYSVHTLGLRECLS